MSMILAFSYIAICVSIGILGKDRKFGFWGYTFGSMLFTPILGILLVLASDKRRIEKTSDTER